LRAGAAEQRLSRGGVVERLGVVDNLPVDESRLAAVRAKKRGEAAGKAKLAVRPSGKAKQRLKRNGKTKVEATVTYTPTGDGYRALSRYDLPVPSTALFVTDR
jgi:hypothetical protein